MRTRLECVRLFAYSTRTELTDLEDALHERRGHDEMTWVTGHDTHLNLECHTETFSTRSVQEQRFMDHGVPNTLKIPGAIQLCCNRKLE